MGLLDQFIEWLNQLMEWIGRPEHFVPLFLAVIFMIGLLYALWPEE